ncbi:hypothetical protein RU639_013576 [Aspergillus parasiticus]
MGTTSDTVAGSWIVLLKPYVSEDGLASLTEAVQTSTQDPSKPYSANVKQEFNLPECRGFSGKFNLGTKEDIEKMDKVLSIEPVRLLKHCQRIIQRPSPWGLERISQPRRVQPNEPYRYIYDDAAAGQIIVAYIIDTGINEDHVDFEMELRHQPTTSPLHQSPSQLPWAPWIKQTRFRIFELWQTCRCLRAWNGYYLNLDR